MKAFGIFFVALLVSTLADGISTYCWARHLGDWRLTHELNPLLRGSSLQAMVVQGAFSMVVLCLMFALAWAKRTDFWPAQAGYAWRQWWNYANRNVLPELRRVTRAPRLRMLAVFLGIALPVSMVVMHLDAALMNALQVMGIIRISTRALVLSLIVFLSLTCAAGTWFLLYISYRWTYQGDGDRTAEPS